MLPNIYSKNLLLLSFPSQLQLRMWVQNAVQRCSCIDALLKIQHEYLSFLDNKNLTAISIFATDFSKAIDNVRKVLFSEKLKALPLDPSITNLSFFKEQKQREIFKGTVCDWKIVNQ